MQNEEEDSHKQQDIDLALPTSSGNLDEEEDLYGGNSDEEDGPLGQIDVFIPGSSGIPEWVSHQNKGCEVRIELPMNWYEDNHAQTPLHLLNDSKIKYNIETIPGCSAS